MKFTFNKNNELDCANWPKADVKILDEMQL